MIDRNSAGVSVCQAGAGATLESETRPQERVGRSSVAVPGPTCVPRTYQKITMLVTVLILTHYDVFRWDSSHRNLLQCDCATR